jgi:ketosteroid isomerase-like protein
MSDIEIVAEIYEAFAEKDLNRLFALADEACVITQDPSLPWGGRHLGHDGLVEFASTLLRTVDSTLTVEVMFEADGDIIQRGRVVGTVRANAVPFDLPEVHRWTIRDGKAIAAHFSLDTPAMLRALRHLA